MAEYITSRLEIIEAGIPVSSEGEHEIKVLGARKEIKVASQSGEMTDLTSGDTSKFLQFLTGELTPPPADAGASDEPFAVPQAIVLADGDIGFLKRGGTV